MQIGSSKLKPMVKYIKLAFTVTMLCFLIFLASRIVNLNMAEVIFTKNTSQDTNIDDVLHWNNQHSEALLKSMLNKQDVAFDIKLAYQLLNAMPYDARLYAILARKYTRYESYAITSESMRMAALMAPQRTDILLEAASFCLEHGDIAQGLEYIDRALSKDTRSYELLFPVLLQILEQPQSSVLIEGMLRLERAWKVPFFVYALGHTKNFGLIRAVVGHHESSQADTSPRLRDALVRRLQKENLWDEAYFEWLNDLSDEQMRHTGYVFNGGFEVSPSAGGFDWIITKAPGVDAGIYAALGVRDSSALSVRFLGLKTPFRHVLQYMVLSSGTYSLTGKLRLDDLKAFMGVRWDVTCLEGGHTLGATDAFMGQSDWQGFEAKFSVPDAGCSVQVLRLELVGKAALDFQATGGVFFDEINIKKLD